MAEVMPLILISLRSAKGRRIYDTNKEITMNKMSVWTTVKNAWPRVLLCFCLTSSQKATGRNRGSLSQHLRTDSSRQTQATNMSSVLILRWVRSPKGICRHKFFNMNVQVLAILLHGHWGPSCPRPNIPPNRWDWSKLLGNTLFSSSSQSLVSGELSAKSWKPRI